MCEREEKSEMLNQIKQIVVLKHSKKKKNVTKISLETLNQRK